MCGLLIGNGFTYDQKDFFLYPRCSLYYFYRKDIFCRDQTAEY